jgi:hypothetical protein
LAARTDRLRELDAAAEPILDRMRAAWRLLALPEIAARLPENARSIERWRIRLEARTALQRVWPSVAALRVQMALMGILFHDLQQHQDNTSVRDLIHKTGQRIAALLREIRAPLEAIPYPYEHGGGSVTLGAHLVPEIPAADDFGNLFGAGESLANKFYTLDHRLLAGTIVLAEQIETAIGLPLVPEPPEDPPA